MSEKMAEMDAATLDEMTSAAFVIADQLGDPRAGRDGDPVVSETVTELAEWLTELAPEERTKVWRAEWPAATLLAVFAKLPAERLPDMVTEYIAAGDALGLCRAALAQAAAVAAEPEDVLAPGSVASLLVLACQRSGDGLGYLASLVRAAATPADFVAALGSTVVPASVSRPMSALHAAALRFGLDVADALTRAHLCARLIGPALTAAGTTLLATTLDRIASGEPIAGGGDLVAALTEANAQIVAAGYAADAISAEGEDPDDLLTQRGGALRDIMGLLDTFTEPTPPDPLGTKPRLTLTALGQAILRARLHRPAGYDWAATKEVEWEKPDRFADLLADERAQVLDLVLEEAGIVATESLT